MTRASLSFILRRAEGAAFALLLVLLVPGLLIASAARLARGRAAARRWPAMLAASVRRWGKFLAHGLRPVREAWWPAMSYEPPLNVWRYVFLLELFDLVNVAGADRAPAEPGERARALVVKLAHVGDALHIGPSLRALREQRPGWSLDLVAGPWCDALIRKIPYVAESVPYAPHLVLFNRGRGERGLSLAGEAAFLWRLRRRRYDWLFSTSVTSLVEVCLIQAARPALWVGAAHDAGLWYPFSEARTRPYTSRQYEAQRIADLLPLIGVRAPRAELEYWLTDTERAEAARRLAEAGLCAPVVAVAPGAGWPGKLWPVERFAELADRLAERQHASILLLGSPGERELAEQMKSRMRRPALNLAGQTTLDQMAALLAESDLLVGNDSAPMHFAVAAGTPALCLFGPTSRPQWGPPEGGPHRVLQAPKLCFDCHPFHPRATCHDDRSCMKSLSVDAVADAAEAMLRDTSHVRDRGIHDVPVRPG